MPFTAPHLVNNLDNVSITISMTSCTEETRRTETIHRGNHKLRKMGLKLRPVGQNPKVDAVKHAAFRAYLDVRARRLGKDPLIPDWAMTY